MLLQIPEITRLFETLGASPYGALPLTHLQHALQCAQFAERANSPPELVAAALLHDIGHLLASYAEELPANADDGHQYIALPLLRGMFPDAVTEPIRLHVDAGRYLCAMDSTYWTTLSSASRKSLSAQGGPFSASEATLFIRRPYAREAVALHRWDVQASAPLARTSEWSHFLPVLHRFGAPAPAV